jgi:hypothetical protein
VIADLHLLLAAVTAAGAIAVVAFALLGRRMDGTSRLWIDRAILAAIAGVVLAIVSGLVVFATGGTPEDPLHFLSAAAALVALPIARAWATGAHAGRRWLVMAAAGAVLAALVLRLYMTGGS